MSNRAPCCFSMRHRQQGQQDVFRAWKMARWIFTGVTTENPSFELNTVVACARRAEVTTEDDLVAV